MTFTKVNQEVAQSGPGPRALLWANDPVVRLRAARAIDEKALNELTEALLEGCPSAAWPYGCATTVNPWIVFLGASPGVSPAPGDKNYILRVGDPPVAGSPHKTMLYPDGRGFFVRLQRLTQRLLEADSNDLISRPDALSLAGLMNLDSGARGRASEVRANPVFARWSLSATIERLQPRYVFALGLRGFLRQPRNIGIVEALDSHVRGGFDIDSPPITIPFHGYSKQAYVFRIWALKQRGTSPCHLVLLPQHPSRAPMTSLDVWDSMVSQFVDIAPTLS